MAWWKLVKKVCKSVDCVAGAGADAKECSFVHFEGKYRYPAELKIAERWGSSIIVSKGRSRDVLDLPGYVALRGETLVGYLFCEVVGGVGEIVLMDSFRMRCGVGSELMDRALAYLKKRGCTRVFVVTTNDNTDAMRFYQKHGFRFAAIRRDAVTAKAEVKREISLVGYGGIPVRDEVELDLSLGGPKGVE